MIIFRETHYIDIRIHFGYSLEEKKAWLQAGKIDLFKRALSEGIFDNIGQSYKITFNKIPYDEQEKEYAIKWLIDYFLCKQFRNLDGAIKQANEEYEKLKPYNLEMIVEVDDEKYEK